MKSKPILGFGIGMVLVAASALAMASDTTRPLMQTNASVLCYAATAADEASLPVVLAEIARRDLACSAEMVETGQARLASIVRAQERQKLSGQAAKVPPNRVVYCTLPGSAQSVRCPNY